MTERLLMSPPDVGALEEQYVVAAIRSGWVAPTGPEVTAFEAEISAVAGVSHAVALSSRTAALHLAMLGVGVRPGDVVVVATMTFVASANAVTYTGASASSTSSPRTATSIPSCSALPSPRSARPSGRRRDVGSTCWARSPTTSIQEIW